ncbi:unnamed protein product [[Candida] boidinii]|uniref:Protein-serine/threonine kinase n=1 Tax=Candida boidinii TaxID=5477 RepID=A0A9W6SX54_CANBO|nr:hypothetical protein B5S30_g5385 [[Candida] boidinii]GME69044.1 unnamed protein product [[Candida] boidinii]GME95384.1 unnamed protein product [[Candida] boidinii]GMF49422.1 unnamed protein product [[Candida] boidinii]
MKIINPLLNKNHINKYSSLSLNSIINLHKPKVTLNSINKNSLNIIDDLPILYSKQLLSLKNPPDSLPNIYKKPFIDLSKSYKSSFQNIINFKDNNKLLFESFDHLDINNIDIEKTNKTANYLKKLIFFLNPKKTELDIFIDSFESFLKDELNKRSNDLIRLTTDLKVVSNGNLKNFDSNNIIHNYLNKIYYQRIQINFLLSHQLCLFNQRNTENSKFIGVINPNTNIYDLLEDSIVKTFNLFESNGYDYDLNLPDIKINLNNKDLTISCIPNHVIHIIFEVLKNSVLATMHNTNSSSSSSSKEPIIINVFDDPDSIEIKICDQGGGIPRDKLSKIWSYHYTTTDSKTSENSVELLNSTQKETIISGLGFGLPLCKLYILFNHGEFELINHEGFGVDVIIRLPKGINYSNFNSPTTPDIYNRNYY